MSEQRQPRRIQRKRTKGWTMSENAVYVGRPSVWGNPFAIGQGFWNRIPVDNEGAVGFFREMVGDAVMLKYAPYPSADRIKRDLRGKNLACWCPLDQPCHADVLLEIANQ